MKYLLVFLLLPLTLLFSPASTSAQITYTNASPSAANHLLLRSHPAQTTTASLHTPLLKETVFQQTRQTVKETLQTQRQALRSQLSIIKDQRKQLIVETISDQIASVSAAKTQAMHQALSTMTTILTQFSTQAQALKDAGKDTTELEIDIAKAQAAIATADASVTAQAGKTYPLTITSDTTLRQTIGQTMSQFRQDMTGAYQQVLAARQAMLMVARDLMPEAAGVSSSISGIMKP